ncbi:MAG: TIGR03619 family F420-dependent LLM class oxidoreductase [Alphaproteobacteria bacterium]|nr:TIGR03619 family F420-dependent LLM class oxidoreductase [Alphaproteobacteria bacterium]
MKFGVSIFVTHFSAGPAEIAVEAERLGFESLFVSEHSHIPVDTQFALGGDVPMAYRSMLDPFVALGAAAAVTRTITLGTAICILPQHDPIHCAKAVSTLDQVSGGRIVFGIGAGWNPPEMENHGVAFGNRFKVMRERAEAIRRLWTEDEAEYHGDFVDFSRSWQWPKPLQKPHPPILVAGAGAGVIKRAVGYGDGWMPVIASQWHESMRGKMTPLHELPMMVAEQRQLEEAAGRGRTSITALGLPPTAEFIDALEENGVERMVFGLPHDGREQAFAQLQAYADAISAYRGA